MPILFVADPLPSTRPFSRLAARKCDNCVANTRTHRASHEHSEEMKKETHHAQSSLSETMAARIKIEELGDPARQRKITDAVLAVDGVIETKIQKGVLHVSYDPLVTTEKKSSRLSAPPAVLSKPRP